MAGKMGKSVKATTTPGMGKKMSAHEAEMARRAANLAAAQDKEKASKKAHDAEMARRALNLRKQKSGY